MKGFSWPFSKCPPEDHQVMVTCVSGHRLCSTERCDSLDFFPSLVYSLTSPITLSCGFLMTNDNRSGRRMEPKAPRIVLNVPSYLPRAHSGSLG